MAWRCTSLTEVMDRDDFVSLVDAVASHRNQRVFVKLYDYFGPRIYRALTIHCPPLPSISYLLPKRLQTRLNPCDPANGRTALIVSHR